MTSLDDVARLAKAHRQKQAASEKSRRELHAGIRSALAAGVTQAELARTTGYTRETIRQIARQDQP